MLNEAPLVVVHLDEVRLFTFDANVESPRRKCCRSMSSRPPPWGVPPVTDVTASSAHCTGAASGELDLVGLQVGSHVSSDDIESDRPGPAFVAPVGRSS